jgi:hypothetical protein
MGLTPKQQNEILTSTHNMHKKQQWIGRKEEWQQLDNNEMTMCEDVDNFMSKSKQKLIN